jgi:hypothetical protein
MPEKCVEMVCSYCEMKTAFKLLYRHKMPIERNLIEYKPYTPIAWEILECQVCLHLTIAWTHRVQKFSMFDDPFPNGII